MRRSTPWRRIGYRLEAILLHALFGLARLLPIDAASAIGGSIARTIGPRLPVSNTGRRNLSQAFPEKSKAEIEAILRGVWDNLGRTTAEYPHLTRIWDYTPEPTSANRRVEFVGLEHFAALRDDGAPGLIFSGHLANWELLPVGAARHDLPVASLYRPPNNPYAAELVRQIRSAAMGGLIASGLEGALGAVRVMEQGGHIGMLIDQRFRRGIPVPFFGRPAQTATVLAKLARRFDCPVHGARVERLGGARFRVTLSPPLAVPRTEDANADIAAIMAEATAMLEGWIRERPEQWLWLHNRWRA